MSTNKTTKITASQKRIVRELHDNGTRICQYTCGGGFFYTISEGLKPSEMRHVTRHLSNGMVDRLFEKGYIKLARSSNGFSYLLTELALQEIK